MAWLGSSPAPTLALLIVVVASALAAAPPLRLRRAAATGLLVALILPLGLACGRDEPAPRPAVAREVFGDRTAALLPLRRALAQGAEGTEALLATAPREGGNGAIVRLWEAELRLRQLRLEAAATLLAGSEAGLPLGDLLRARLAFLRSDEKDALVSYGAAVERGLDFDAARLEAAEALFLFGYPYEGDALLRDMAEEGSRSAAARYQLAEVAAFEGRGEDALLHFKSAWRLRPMTRAGVLRSAGLARIATHTDVFPQLGMAAAGEPSIARSTLPPEEVIALPPGVQATTSGDHLTLRFADRELEIAGGADLVAITTAVEDAGGAERREEEAALASLPRWIEDGAVRAMALPAQRRQLERLVGVLVARGRWNDVASVTRGIEHRLDQTPPLLVIWRARALSESGHDGEAVKLLLALLRNERANRRRDPGVLYSFAELLVEQQQHAAALRVLQRARSLSPFVPESRIRQVEMEQELAEEGSTLVHGRFELRYPRGSDPEFVRGLAELLETERRRLERWIPRGAGPARQVGVDLFPVAEFLEAYSPNGILVIGLFDGRLRLPLANASTLHPRIVEVISHELAHALIDESTGGLAPKWLHEGLAQHAELAEVKSNPLPYMAEKGELLSVGVVESALRGFAEPTFVGIAYDQSHWTLAFVEARHGVSGIHRLLAAFAAGDTTEEAVRRALDSSVSELDRDLREWVLRDAPRVVRARVPRYDLRELGGARAAVAEAAGRVRAEPAAAAAGSRAGAVDAAAGSARAATRPGGAAAAQQPAPSAPLTGPVTAYVVTPAYRAWQARYDAAVGPLRSRITTAATQVRSATPSVTTQAVCSQLSEELAELLGGDVLLEAPPPEVRPVLVGMYGWLASMSRSCSLGDWTVARSHLDRAERELGVAQRILVPRGMQP
jgi:tetratricopeptide (TPR) repeat protein